ncbi:hypothetical protein Pint_05241 [Pistacia integerrima]|uniref:Uncharacterized protein n=1 Tax=Pistacia integerrima TaxID=434235 RepID=A0ACC0Z4J6_9ROSI|nr:hypothetical protein Pint_05241 [Pistacia integerrima]
MVEKLKDGLKVVLEEFHQLAGKLRKDEEGVFRVEYDDEMEGVELKTISLALLQSKRKMADGILFDMAGKLFQLLGPHVFQEIGLAWGVQDDITKIKETVRSMKAVLLDAEKQHSKTNQTGDRMASKAQSCIL